VALTSADTGDMPLVQRSRGRTRIRRARRSDLGQVEGEMGGAGRRRLWVGIQTRLCPAARNTAASGAL